MVMTKGGSVPLSIEVITKDIVCENAKNQPGKARGLGRHGGEASALCVGSDDVGLELLALLILLCLSIVRASSTLRSACAKLVLFFQEKRKGKKRIAATDANHCTGQRRHDMAAGTSPKDDLLSKLPQQPSQITCPSSKPLSNPILLKAKSFFPKSLSDAPR